MSALAINEAAGIVRDAGRKIVGRTRLQKIAYLLSACGLENNFSFEYRHYGPYSEELATAVRIARLSGLVNETEQPAQWGGTYSTYTTTVEDNPKIPAVRRKLAEVAAGADAIELELAATAAFLATEDCPDPWTETARRKPEKADSGRLDRAKTLYRTLQAIETPVRLPEIP